MSPSGLLGSRSNQPVRDNGLHLLCIAEHPEAPSKLGPYEKNGVLGAALRHWARPSGQPKSPDILRLLIDLFFVEALTQGTGEFPDVRFDQGPSWLGRKGE